jgi:hypothetical protein
MRFLHQMVGTDRISTADQEGKPEEAIRFCPLSGLESARTCRSLAQSGNFLPPLGQGLPLQRGLDG